MCKSYIRLISLLLLPLAALVFAASGEKYKSASVDQSGQLHILLDSGKEVLPNKIKGQVSFNNPKLSPDRRTIGWVVMYPDISSTGYEGTPLAFNLVLYRAGRVLRTFATEPTLWDWEFQARGKRVAFSTGPTHGGATECILRDVDSGRTVARWRVREGVQAPAWTRTLRQ